MTDEFIGDPLQPDTTTFDPARMAAGEPGLPGRFLWRGEPVAVRTVLHSWRETGECRHGSGERYVRKHWYELVTTHGTMKVYFERKARGGAKGARWWLYSMRPNAAAVTRSGRTVPDVPDWPGR